MTVTIENLLAPGPVAIPLTTGQWLRLSPREKSPDAGYRGDHQREGRQATQTAGEVVTHSPAGDPTPWPGRRLRSRPGTGPNSQIPVLPIDRVMRSGFDRC